MKYGHSKCQGVTSVEFALGSLVLIITTLMIFEMGFRIYVTNMVEYALRETVRNTTVFEGQSSYDQYNQTLNTAMEEPDRLWGFLTPADNFQLSGKYYLTYADLISDVSFDDDQMAQSGIGYAVAEITLTYNYTPVLNLFGSDPTAITRSTRLNLEHEGWEEE
jgi:tight adherence protein E